MSWCVCLSVRQLICVSVWMCVWLSLTVCLCSRAAATLLVLHCMLIDPDGRPEMSLNRLYLKKDLTIFRILFQTRGYRWKGAPLPSLQHTPPR